MNRKEVEQYLIDFQAQEPPSLVRRQLPAFSTRKINAIIGPRRAGKTFALFQVMQGLPERKKALYLNFEHIQLAGITARDILDIVALHEELFKTTPTLFLDEPQNVPGWERAVRTLFDRGYRIFVSGSSSKLLGREIATSLRGRSLSYPLLPFSFREYLAFRKQEIPWKPSTAARMRMLSLLNDYLESGGFPELLFEEDDTLRMRTLEQYLDLVVYRDVVERHGIRDTSLVRWLIKALLSGYAREFSVNRLFNTLRSQGRSVNKNDLYEYVSLLEDGFFVLMLPPFSWSPRKRAGKQKAYLCDTGFARLAPAGREAGRAMENAAYLELLRTLKPGQELSYWKSSQQDYEVDFVVREGGKVTRLIQCCYDLSDADTRAREMRALLHAGRDLRCETLLIITRDEEGAEEMRWFDLKGTVSLLPMWKWMVGI